ncbi:hypothetical protein NJB1907f44_43200 [Mycobacterium marinum]|nr:hypothetical protein NJB1907E8_44960 [Mycobacterium marinum]GJO15600.1 hypothetical protein NJB1907E90_42490 [Mycobacterium marinum]GJO27225.1 hypothetical protein NJB1907E11_43400 [Mycobacterium marinum]GJO38417.1 hypothetical protein NJB1907f22_45740 [Mycobacterium marinum]GJO48166.1 hypothetical protein NJB1907E19_44170 [Mycobacterium marinum]
MLSDAERQPKPKFPDALIGRGEIVEVGGLHVDVLHSGADRVDRQAVCCGDGYRVMSLVDPQESDLELDAADRLIDEVAQSRVEHGVKVAADLVWPLRRDGHVSDAAGAGDEAASRANVQWRWAWARLGVDLLGQAVGPGESREPRHPAQGGLFGRTFDDRDALAPNPIDDFLECVVVVELPAQGRDVLRRSVL